MYQIIYKNAKNIDGTNDATFALWQSELPDVQFQIRSKLVKNAKKVYNDPSLQISHTLRLENILPIDILNLLMDLRIWRVVV